MKRFRIITGIMLIFLCLIAVFCGNKASENRVPLDQLDNTKSNDYRYIFREVIMKQEKQDKKYKKNEFRD
jgi:hypothetical protein